MNQLPQVDLDRICQSIHIRSQNLAVQQTTPVCSLMLFAIPQTSGDSRTASAEVRAVTVQMSPTHQASQRCHVIANGK